MSAARSKVVVRVATFADAPLTAGVGGDGRVSAVVTRDNRVIAFMGGKVKNLEAAEQKRLGLGKLTGVLVVEAPEGSALQRAHLVKNDVILSWDKDDVPDLATLLKLSQATPSPVLINAWHDFATLGLYR